MAAIKSFLQIYFLPCVLAAIIIGVIPSHFPVSGTLENDLQQILEDSLADQVRISLEYQSQSLGETYLIDNPIRALGLIKESKFFINNLNKLHGSLKIKLYLKDKLYISTVSKAELNKDHALQVLLNLVDLAEKTDSIEENKV